jgi:hypothetical protein
MRTASPRCKGSARARVLGRRSERAAVRRGHSGLKETEQRNTELAGLSTQFSRACRRAGLPIVDPVGDKLRGSSPLPIWVSIGTTKAPLHYCTRTSTGTIEDCTTAAVPGGLLNDDVTRQPQVVNIVATMAVRFRHRPEQVDDRDADYQRRPRARDDRYRELRTRERVWRVELRLLSTIAASL